jgi:hypothetical protein
LFHGVLQFIQHAAGGKSWIREQNERIYSTSIKAGCFYAFYSYDDDDDNM